MLSYRINILLSLSGFYNKTCVWITSPPLCYPEKLAVAQSAPGSSEGNVISVIKGSLWKRLALGLAASLTTEQQLGLRYLPGLWPLPGNTLGRKLLVLSSSEYNSMIWTSHWHWPKASL